MYKLKRCCLTCLVKKKLKKRCTSNCKYVTTKKQRFYCAKVNYGTNWFCRQIKNALAVYSLSLTFPPTTNRLIGLRQIACGAVYALWGASAPLPRNVAHDHREYHRERDAAEDAGDQHGGAKHAGHALVLLFHHLRCVLHAQRTAKQSNGRLVL